MHEEIHYDLDGRKINHKVINLMGLKLKFKYTPKIKVFNNKIFLVKPSGKKVKILPVFLKNYGIEVIFKGSNNTLIFHQIENLSGSRFHFYGSNNLIIMGKHNIGKWGIACYEDNNKAKIGSYNQCCDINIVLASSKIFIGNKNMFSNNIKVWSDGHAVIDYNTKQVLNLPKKPIKIGSHIWLGERVTLTKNAEIPDDTIVGIASVVTKAFYEKHTVIAGNPACVVKNGISWHGASPINYYKNIQPKIYSPPERLEKGSLASGGR